MSRNANLTSWREDLDYHVGNGALGYTNWPYPSDNELVADRSCLEYSGIGEVCRDGKKMGCFDHPTEIRPAHR